MSEIWPPYMIRPSMSKPLWSVPSGYCELGGAFAGAVSSAFWVSV